MNFDISTLRFDKNGLIPAVVQDEKTGEVLTLAYMNEEAIAKTLETKETWFFSRSRNELWHKGESSGNTQRVVRLQQDCDADALLLQVVPDGPACHTGNRSCFSETITEDAASNRTVLHELVQKIKERKENPVEDSYTTYLFREGIDKILKKVGEESAEVIIGAKNNNKKEITWEISDLIYHTLVLMELVEVDITDLKVELFKRHLQKQGEQNA
ncbi:bifunctional phosphoribosyl-AMP cyclohydrolase/phosphoribosyl-ATP diphosphatase HisIE [Virgibacillus halophilus]|uniref:bifunctional phosphoribosyl-AMP cyclohydrolase/phosphoribosyl-ATP diphosphatase HisIE n=1 Tax=Tigheibacillus halophilus TaxID=361280 RepID=UPI00362C25CF